MKCCTAHYNLEQFAPSDADTAGGYGAAQAGGVSCSTIEAKKKAYKK